MGAPRVLLPLLAAAAATAASAENNTCAYFGCGIYMHGQVCQCNSACASHKDCCADYQKTCGSGPAPGPSPPMPPVGPSCGGGVQQVHLALTRDPSQMVISYTTCARYSEPTQCAVGLKGSPRTEWRQFEGSSSTYTDGGWLGLLHTVLVTGLAVDGRTSYSYRCGSNGTEWTFASVPPRGTLPLTVAAVADLGESCSRPGCGNDTIKALGAGAAAGDFAAIIHAGDIAYTSGHQGIWDEFMTEMEPAVARVPYQVCVGNHEHYYNFSGYLHRFAMPGDQVSQGKTVSINNLYHSYDLGGVHFVAFSTEHDLGMQLDWLRNDLAKAAAPAQRKVVPWIVMYGHKPIYCSTNDYYDCQVNGPQHVGPAIEPLLRAYDVDLFFAGHLHNYERSWPISGNGSVTAKSYENAAATVHLVLGMAGDNEGLTNSWEKTTPAWRAYKDAEVAFGKMQFVSATQMDFELVRSDSGQVIDSFTLTRAR